MRLIFGSLSNQEGNVNRKSVECHFCSKEKGKHKNLLFFKIKFKYFINHCVQKASLYFEAFVDFLPKNYVYFYFLWQFILIVDQHNTL